MEVRNRRWWVCALLFLATVISYVDRQTISIAAPVIAREFSLSNEQLASILSAFLFAYTFGQLLAGRFFDWIGSRRGFAISVSVWSLANVLTAWVKKPWGFEALRFMLGAGESGNFPGGIKVIAEWFPVKDRAFAGGLFTSGGSVGAILAGPLVGTVTHYWGWRAAFLVTGSLGFIWLAAWLWFYRPPERGEQQDAGSEVTLRWVDLLRFRQVWALVVGRLLEEPIIWMSVFWLPKYFVDVRGTSLLHTGWLLTWPFISLDLGYIAGGWISTRLIRAGWSVRSARLTVMSGAAVMMMSAIPAGLAESTFSFTLFISMATMAHGMWFTNVLTLPADFTPHSRVATVYGISGAGGGLSGILATQATGFVADRFHSFTPVFVVAGILPLIGTALLAWLLGPMRMISPKRES